MKKLLLNAILILGVIGFAGFAFASSLPLGGQTYYLAGAGVNSTQNTIQLTYFLTPDGTPITMSNFGTIGYGVLDPQTTSKIEDVSFTGVTQNANGTATLTGVTRGVQFDYPYTTSAPLEKSHAGGATFIISNTAEFYYNEFSMQNNSNVFTWPSASSSPATKGYVDAISFGGVLPQASLIAQGAVQFATGVQQASSTASGSAGPLALYAANATSTYNAATAPLKVVVTNNAGTIDPNFINLSSYSGALGTSTQIGYLPAYQIALQRQVFTGTGTTTFSVPSGVTLANVQVVGGGGAGGSSGACNAIGFSITGGGGGAGGYANKIVNLTGTTSVQVYVGATTQWSTFGTNGFYLSATGGTNGNSGSGGGASGGAGGTATGGDFNINGQNGFSGSSVSGSSVSNGSQSAGAGASNPFGFGGATVSANTSGQNATGYGSGAGAGSCSDSGTSQSGGTGAQGIVVISW